MVDDIALRFIGRKAHCLRAVARDRQQGNHRLMDFTAVVHAAAAQYHTNFFIAFAPPCNSLKPVKNVD
ncbi:hypothetical protein LNO78_23420 [Klebsiella pneumoniae subsp. pneumoniae]|nr:hypothetical protein [Klebsiella pneumoniae subsp. pneumoniae]MDO6175878.1 hypothetical protein [Klebsiella pneumoniae]MDQ6191799.1 hypothetical protein [Klebsiella pneumoniae]